MDLLCEWIIIFDYRRSQWAASRPTQTLAHVFQLADNVTAVFCSLQFYFFVSARRPFALRRTSKGLGDHTAQLSRLVNLTSIAWQPVQPELQVTQFCMHSRGEYSLRFRFFFFISFVRVVKLRQNVNCKMIITHVCDWSPCFDYVRSNRFYFFSFQFWSPIGKTFWRKLHLKLKIILSVSVWLASTQSRPPPENGTFRVSHSRTRLSISAMAIYRLISAQCARVHGKLKSLVVHSVKCDPFGL